jgi:hypothetical protein
VALIKQTRKKKKERKTSPVRDSQAQRKKTLWISDIRVSLLLPVDKLRLKGGC